MSRKAMDINKCFICGKEHEIIPTPFPFNGIDCPNSKRTRIIEFGDGIKLPIDAEAQLDPDNIFYGWSG